MIKSYEEYRLENELTKYAFCKQFSLNQSHYNGYASNPAKKILMVDGEPKRIKFEGEL